MIRCKWDYGVQVRVGLQVDVGLGVYLEKVHVGIGAEV